MAGGLQLAVKVEVLPARIEDGDAVRVHVGVRSAKVAVTVQALVTAPVV